MAGAAGVTSRRLAVGSGLERGGALGAKASEARAHEAKAHETKASETEAE